MSENEDNVKNPQILLLNYLITYLIKNKNKNKNRNYNLTLRIDKSVYDSFVDVCGKLGLLPGRSKGNLAVEGFMSFMVEKFKNHPQIVQTTLFYKPHIEKVEVKQQFNIAQKLELKLVKQDLTAILNGLEQKRGDPAFLLARLREVLPKAIRLYQKTSNAEIAELLEKTEKWI